MNEQLSKAAESYRETAVEIRRDLHRHPEPAWTEYRTTSKILRFLMDHGIENHCGPEVINPDYIWGAPDAAALEKERERALSQGAEPELLERMQGYTGAMAVIRSGRPGPCTMFRFDIDCNDVSECQKDSHRPHAEGFDSLNPNRMHACGHDGHTTMGLLLAAVLQENRSEWSGTVRILFQPAEEGDRGAQSMVERGVLAPADVLFGMHLYPAGEEYPALGGTQTGLYATTKFDVHITGKSAHAGAAPEQGANAILAAVHAISGMQCFEQDSRGAARLNIGTIQGGTGRNVIPQECFFRAETRGSSTENEKRLYEKALLSVKTACELFDCTYTSEIKGYGPMGSGDRDLAEQITRIAGEIPDFRYTRPIFENTGGTDDFSYMMSDMQKRGKKACYMALLTRLSAGLHNSEYDFDECCLIPGVKICLDLVEHASELI